MKTAHVLPLQLASLFSLMVVIYIAMVTYTKYAMGHKSAIMYLTIILANRSHCYFHVQGENFPSLCRITSLYV